jgi:copper transport protein
MFLASVAIMARRPGLGRWISVSSLAAIGLTAALSGHASSADPRWLMRTMIFLHVTSIAWWAGELLPLALLLRQPEAGANPPLMRFSQFIPFVIVPLVISGLTLTAIQLGLPGPSLWTPYTYLLVAKVQLLVVLFAAAAWNRWVLTGRVMAGESAAARHLRASIFFEIVLIAAIVGVAAGWRFTAPPRAIHQEVVDRVVQMELDVDIGALHGQLTIEPGRAGSNVLTVSLLDQAGAPVPVRSVRIFLSSDELGVERIELVGREEVGGWRAEDAIVPVSGKWIVSVEVRISDFEQLHSRAAVTIEK